MTNSFNKENQGEQDFDELDALMQDAADDETDGEDWRAAEKQSAVNTDPSLTGGSFDAEFPESDEAVLDLEGTQEVKEAVPASEKDPGDFDIDEALEKGLAELREELRSKPGDWYAVHTYSGMEKRVQQNVMNRATSLNMEDYIYEAVVPTEEIIEVRNGIRKTVRRTVLPGYCLIRMELTDESWGTVRHTPSVTGFVGNANAPVPLSLEEVEKMMAPAVQAQVNLEAAKAQSGSKKGTKRKIEIADYSVGDSVMVVDGPFAGVHASIIELNPNSQRLKAMVEILGRDTPVDLTFQQISRVV